MPVAAVLFDCDGVLVDTEVTSAQVLADCLTESGSPTDPDELRRTIKGTSLHFVREEVGRRLGRDVDDAWFDSFVARRLAAFRQGVEPMDGAEDAVAAVRAAGIPVAVVSQGAREKMTVTLPSSGIAAVLGDAPIFSGDDVERGKPHPDLYLLAARTLGVAADACVVVEDSPTGATAARAAGMRVLGYVADSDEAAMRDVGAEPINDLRDVPGLIGA